MAKKVKGYTRSDGTKVKGHSRGGKAKRYTASQRRAFKKSQTSKSGHKTAAQRKGSKRPGLWANYWNKRKRQGTWKPKKR